MCIRPSCIVDDKLHLSENWFEKYTTLPSIIQV